MVLHTGFFTKTSKPSPVGTDQAYPPQDQDSLPHLVPPWECLRLLLWVSLHHVPGWVFQFQQGSVFVSGGEGDTKAAPIRHRHFIPWITVHSSLCIGLLLFSKLWLSDWEHFIPEGLLFNAWLSLFPCSPAHATEKGPMSSKQVQTGWHLDWGAIPEIFSIFQPPVIS